MTSPAALRERPAAWRRAVSAMLGLPMTERDAPCPADAPSAPAFEAEPLAAPAPRRGRAPRRLLVEATLDDEELSLLEAELSALLAKRASPPILRRLNAARDLPWTELSYLALDTETSGLDPGRDRVIELAWVRMERGRETARAEALCRIDERLPEEVAEITGISDEMLESQRRFEELAPALLEAMAGVDFIAAYNAPFDRAFLSRELERLGMTLPDVPWVDALVFIREVDRFKPGKSLQDASRRWGVGIERPHRALDDALATGELLLRVAPFLPAHTLEELLEQQQRLNARQRLEERAYAERCPPETKPPAEAEAEAPPTEPPEPS